MDSLYANSFKSERGRYGSPRLPEMASKRQSFLNVVLTSGNISLYIFRDKKIGLSCICKNWNGYYLYVEIVGIQWSRDT